jgi:hypothetical protein
LVLILHGPFNSLVGPKIFLSMMLLFSNATTCPSWTSWSPSRLWPKCNRLLRLGHPWGAITLSRWGGWWYMNMEYQEGP